MTIKTWPSYLSHEKPITNDFVFCCLMSLKNVLYLKELTEMRLFSNKKFTLLLSF
jgi:hypothetical protein